MSDAHVIKSVEQWAEQVRTGVDQIKAANNGVDPAHLRDGHRIDRDAFCRVIEGLYALAEGGAGTPMPDAELQRLAGLKPVAQVLQLP